MLQKIETGSLYKIVSDSPSATKEYFLIVPLTKNVVLLSKKGENPKDKIKKPTAKHVLVIGGTEMEKAAKNSSVFNMPLVWSSKPPIMPDEEPLELGKPILVTYCIKVRNTKTQYYLLDIVIGDKIWESVAYDPTNCKWHLEQVSSEDDLRGI